MGKQKYTKEVEDPTKVAMASGSNLRVHFKNTREAATAIKGLSLVKARRFLEDVLEHKRVVPFRRFTGGIGRPAMMKGTGWSQGRWPAKSCNFLLDLITNLEATAEVRCLVLFSFSLFMLVFFMLDNLSLCLLMVHPSQP
eukprot:TRINITY_DN3276_c0_g1_i1.p1 TRINITY_DN3276_c0_g1~~TRINITY_DN3276_c0_g1_i1.p1  ORF type:complete len:140 (-),score=50.06 TRINITY_DN3276_c0_g1_i1:137-556(-)